MSNRRCLEPGRFLISKWKLHVYVIFATLCFRSMSAGNQCKDIPGNFRFLAKWNVSHGFLDAHEFDRITIDCNTNICNATVSLMVDDVNIRNASAFSEGLEIAGNTFTFVSRLHQGMTEMKCRAEIGSMRIESDPAELLVKRGKRMEPVELSPNVTEITLEKGKDFKITCKAPGYGSSGISYIKWYKYTNGTKTENLGKAMVVRKSIIATDIEELIIKNASIDVQGRYICQRQVGDGPITSAELNVILTDPKRPIVVIRPSSLKLREMQTVTRLICSATSGSPKPTLSWYKSGKKLETCHRMMNCSLLIQNPKYPESEGQYFCEAENSEGKHRAIASIQIIVPPAITKTDFSHTDYVKIAKSNEDAEIRCIVKRSNPLPKFRWFRLIGNQWTEDFEKISITPNTSTSTAISTLVVPSLENAFFSCQASNEAGYDRRNITVLWTGEPIGLTSTSSEGEVLAIVISCSVILILLVVILAFVYNRRILKRYGPYLQPNLQFEFDPATSIHEQSHRMPYDPKWEFPRDNLFMVEPIGKGAFGEVWLAKAQGILEFKAKASSMSPTKRKRFSRMFSFHSEYSNVDTLKNGELSKVAVKTLKADATQSEYKDLASELKILIHIGEHQNIVNLLGACSKSGKLCVILEYCPYGDLSSFLRDKRSIFQPSWKSTEDSFTSMCTYFDLANFTYQIARGMDFLASKKCVHRDLAARNILVSKDHNDAYVLKVADFGMSRDIYTDGVYVKQSSGVLPLKWTAPESIANAIYTSQSDVWSFGIVLWEIFTLGGSPYPGVSTDEFLGYLKTNRKMEQPEGCPDEFYSLMQDCWVEEPDLRPSFAKIYEQIGNMIEEFADVNSTYLRLESTASNETKRLSIDEYSDIGTYVNGSVNSTRKISSNSYQGKKGSGGSEYENILQLEQLNQLNGNEVDDEPRIKYGNALNRERGDENDNLGSSLRGDLLL